MVLDNLSVEEAIREIFCPLLVSALGVTNRADRKEDLETRVEYPPQAELSEPSISVERCPTGTE